MFDFFDEFTGGGETSTDVFDPLYFTSGESSTASSDAQNVDYGWGYLDPSYSGGNEWLAEVGIGGESVDYTLGATPEPSTGDFGTVQYPQAEYSHEGRAYPTSSSARVLNTYPDGTSLAGIGQIIGNVATQAVGLINTARGGAQPVPGKTVPAAPATARPPVQHTMVQRTPADVIGNEAAESAQYRGQLGGGESLLSRIDPLVIAGGVVFVVFLLWKD